VAKGIDPEFKPQCCKIITIIIIIISYSTPFALVLAL
jgi:hypothetical protein